MRQGIRHQIGGPSAWLFLTAALLAASLASLTASTPARGAIGTAGPVTTAGPDIRSATVAEPLVTLCFDQPVVINGQAAAGDVTLAGYDASVTQVGSPPAALGNSCIRTAFPGDLSQYTVATVQAGTVRSGAGGPPNLTDSTPLLGSESQSGSRGGTVAPDLELAIPLGDRNQVLYGFDQDVRCAGAGPAGGTPAGFVFYDHHGATAAGSGFASCEDNQVLVQFGPEASVASAQVAQALAGAVVADTVLATPNRSFSTEIAGRTGRSIDPDLVSGELVDPGGATNHVDFTFDEEVAQAGTDAARFEVILSTAGSLTGSAAQAEGNRVRVTFSDLRTLSEHVVGAAARSGATTARDDGAPSKAGGRPAGGNAGAFALGYTTAPDALGATVSSNGRLVTISVDQRLCSPSDRPRLVGHGGALFGSAPDVVVGTGGLCAGSPGPKEVSFQFSPAELANAAGIYLPGVPFGGPSSFTSTIARPNLDQIVSLP
jgi:hypothetical protein